MSSPWRQFDDWEKCEPLGARDELRLEWNDCEDRFGLEQDSSNDPRSSDTKSEDDNPQEHNEQSPKTFYATKADTITASPTILIAVKKVMVEADKPDRLVGSSIPPSLISSVSSQEYNDKDSLIADMNSTDDPFEGFDVASGSEKDFLVENLRTAAPKDEVLNLRRAVRLVSPALSNSVHQWDTIMNSQEFGETIQATRVSDRYSSGRGWQEFKFIQRAAPDEIEARAYELILSEQDENGKPTLPSLECPAPHLVLEQKVEKFALSHMFNANKHVKPTTLQRREYTRDIYDYARAIGMGKRQANIEVIRTRAVYRRDRGLGEGLQLDESDDESRLGYEINDAVEYITSVKDAMEKCLVDPAGAWADASGLGYTNVSSSTTTRKRKQEETVGCFESNIEPGGSAFDGQLLGAPFINQEWKRRKRLDNKEKIKEPAPFVVDIPASSKRENQQLSRRQRRLRKLEQNSETRSVDQSANVGVTDTQAASLSDKVSNKAGGKSENLEAALSKVGSAEGGGPPDKASSKRGTVPVQPRTADVPFVDSRQKKKKKRKRNKINTMGTISPHFPKLDGENFEDHAATSPVDPPGNAASTSKGDKVLTTIFPDTKDSSKAEERELETQIKHRKPRRKNGKTESRGETEKPNDADIFNERPSQLSRQIDQQDSKDVILASDNSAKPHLEAVSGNANIKKGRRRDRGAKRKPALARIESVPMSGDPLLDEKDETGEHDHTGLGPESRMKKSHIDGIPTNLKMISEVLQKKSKAIFDIASDLQAPITATKHGSSYELNGLDCSTNVEDLPFSDIPKGASIMSNHGSIEWDSIGYECNDTDFAPKISCFSPSTPVNRPRKQFKSDTEGGLKTPRSAKTPSFTFDQGGLTLTAQSEKSNEGTSTTREKPVKAPTKSPFFSPPSSVKKHQPSSPKEKKLRPKASTISCIPFPPLSTPQFGLLQEKLAHDPFRLLIGVTFLNRTKGRDAIPVFYSLMAKYPTPGSILAAPKEDIVALTHHLGLQSQRAETYKKLAQYFIHDPPVKGKRYRVPNYPSHGSGMDISASSPPLDDSDPRSAWEIGHVTKGRYAIDSWRIFCRDVLRGVAKGWNGEGREADGAGFQPEWMRVQPQDKELVALLRWMWLKEGFFWDPVTGEKDVADEELMRAAIEGMITWDDAGGMRVLDEEAVADGVGQIGGVGSGESRHGTTETVHVSSDAELDV